MDPNALSHFKIEETREALEDSWDTAAANRLRQGARRGQDLLPRHAN
jgi:hypothetical protein